MEMVASTPNPITQRTQIKQARLQVPKVSRRLGLLSLAGLHVAAAKPALCTEAQYDRLAEDYDELDGGKIPAALGLTGYREDLLSQASGKVLEIGIGTGLNLQWYVPNHITSLTGVDVSSGMLSVASQRVTSLDWSEKINLVQGDASSLPFGDNSFDTVVDTYSLCVFQNPSLALKEMSRVVRKSGKVLLLEHSRSSNPALGLYQDIVAEPVAAMSKGCVWNQNVLSLLEDSELEVIDVANGLGGLINVITAAPKS